MKPIFEPEKFFRWLILVAMLTASIIIIVRSGYKRTAYDIQQLSPNRYTLTITDRNGYVGEYEDISIDELKNLTK
jgi:hypothetical protein